jgi:hypothetical protein
MGKRATRWASGLAAVLLIAGTATAQEVQTIRPGMTVDDVKAVFGEPAGSRSYGNYTFYFYANGCEYECGTADIVFFDNGQVVDAVLRATWRSYAGESSSPRGTTPRPTPGGTRLQTPGEVQGVEVRPAGTPPPPPVLPDTTADTTRVGG